MHRYQTRESTQGSSTLKLSKSQISQTAKQKQAEVLKMQQRIRAIQKSEVRNRRQISVLQEKTQKIISLKTFDQKLKFQKKFLD